MINTFLAELIGTFFLILLGDGVVANVTLNKSGMKGAGSIQITMAWGLAVLLPAMTFGAVSGAHFNPAVTLGVCIMNGDWSILLPYVVAQMLGAFLGACVVYVLWKDFFDATDDKGTKLGVFSTAPSIPNTFRNFLSEFVGTFVLVFFLDGINQAGAAGGFNWFIVYSVIVSIGMTFGGLTGYAINPARDLGPRLAHFVLPIKDKGDSNFAYGWIPVVAPLCGAVVATLCYMALFVK